MLLLPLSMLILLTWLPRSLGAEVKTYSHRAATTACTLVMCSPVDNGLPGRDGRDGREGPRGEKGDPGRLGPWVCVLVGMGGHWNCDRPRNSGYSSVEALEMD